MRLKQIRFTGIDLSLIAESIILYVIEDIFIEIVTVNKQLCMYWCKK